MKKYTKGAALLLIMTALSSCATTPQKVDVMEGSEKFTMSYPAAHQGAAVDNFHGTQVSDPYRWLEDPASPETKAFIKQQNVLTQSWLDQVPARSVIHKRAAELWNFDQYGVPKTGKSAVFYTVRQGLENQPKIYRRVGEDGPAEVILDPNLLSEDGTKAISSYSVSPDGRYLAYGVSDGGSDWNEWFVRDIQTGQDLDDKLLHIKFSSATWATDGSGFYYGRYPESENSLESLNEHNKLYFHRLNSPQSDDVVAFERPDHPTWGFASSLSSDGKKLIIEVSRGTEDRNLIYLKSTADLSAPAIPIIDEWVFQYQYIGQFGDELLFFTDKDAPTSRVLAVKVNEGHELQWREVQGQDKDTLEGASIAHGKLLLSYLHNAQSRLVIKDLLSDVQREVKLPTIGSVFPIENSKEASQITLLFESFYSPASLYTLDVNTGELELKAKPELTFDAESYVSRQVFYSSKDGTQVPMFIMHRKDLVPDADTPTLLYGYGGFNINLTPSFKVQRLLWMEMGGVLVIPNLRGGGEFGRDWHEAGTKTQKQNVFDDFIAAAEYLIAQGLTSPAKLAITGRSNGGLLAGACLLQRPELFAAAIPGVGVHDMLRYQLFTIGWAWASDYGTVDNPDEFQALYAYSPVHNVVSGSAYPATLITTAERDDRVVPAHSYKFAAALQNGQGADNPILLRVETRAGHGAGKPVAFYLDELTDELSFLVKALNMKPMLNQSE